MKKLLIFFSVVLLATGCAGKQNIAEIPANVVQPAAEKIPDGILPGQLGVVFTIGNLQYRLVQIPSMNIYLPGLSETLSYEQVNELWHGVILSKDNGKTWTKFYTVNNPTGNDGLVIRFNPIGVFEKNVKLNIDIVDSRGAGSGEGNLVRLETPDNGKTWTKTACLYFVHGKYFPTSDLSQIAVDTLAGNRDCQY